MDTTEHVVVLENALQAVNHFFRTQEEYLRQKHDITRIEMDILQLVCRQGPQKMKEISAHYKLKLSTLTSVVDKATSRNLLLRTSSAEDRRVVMVAPTGLGLQIFEDYIDHMQEILADFLRDIHPEQKSHLFHGFRTFLTAYAS